MMCTPSRQPVLSDHQHRLPAAAPSAHPRTLSAVTCLLLSILLAAASLSPAQGFPRNRRQFYTTCWGWGASCALYGRSSIPAIPRRPVKVVRVPERPTQARRTDPFETGTRNSGRLPSPFSSTNWGAGTMGKRNPETSQTDFSTDNKGAMGNIRRAVALRSILASGKQH